LYQSGNSAGFKIRQLSRERVGLVNFCSFLEQKFPIPGLLWEFAEWYFAINRKILYYL
jgi:hypothetical protein